MKLTIATKLYLTVGMACLALLAVGILSFFQMRSLSHEMNGLIKEDIRQVVLSNEAEASLGKAVQSYKNYLVRKDDKYVTEFKEHTKNIETAIGEYMSLASGEEERALGQKSREEFGKYAGCINELVAARAKSDDIAAVDRAITGADKPLAKALADMEELSSKSFESGSALLEKKTTGKLIVIMACAMLIGILVAVQGIAVARNLNRRLARFSSVISNVAAQKDLTTRLKITADDELGVMAKNFNTMLDELEELIASLQQAVISVAEKSRKLHDSASLMEKNAEEIAGQSQSVATASEEMAATSADIANNCGSAAQGAKHASDTAHSGAEVVQNTVGGMHRISEQVRVTATTIEALGTRSDQIGEIVGTIEDIADQTNLLALNAAIEAARAGEQGRGFAVVADEVRALAERTTKATKEIGDMIKTIQSETKGAVSSMEHALGEVVKGSEDAERSGTALQEILNQIQQVNMQVSQIATAAEEQNATTGEITNYIQNVTTIMHGAAEMARASTGAADELAALADTLKAEMQLFKTDGSELFILELAKDDHRTFVDNIEAVLKGTRKLEGAKVSTSHTCRFGKWYDSDGTALCGHLSSFRAISTPHDKIHSIARQVVDAVNSGNMQQAEQLFPQVKELSREIVSLLGDIRKECDQNAVKKAV